MIFFDTFYPHHVSLNLGMKFDIEADNSGILIEHNKTASSIENQYCGKNFIDFPGIL